MKIITQMMNLALRRWLMMMIRFLGNLDLSKHLMLALNLVMTMIAEVSSTAHSIMYLQPDHRWLKLHHQNHRSFFNKSLPLLKSKILNRKLLKMKMTLSHHQMNQIFNSYSNFRSLWLNAKSYIEFKILYYFIII